MNQYFQVVLKQKSCVPRSFSDKSIFHTFSSVSSSLFFPLQFFRQNVICIANFLHVNSKTFKTTYHPIFFQENAFFSNDLISTLAASPELILFKIIPSRAIIYYSMCTKFQADRSSPSNVIARTNRPTLTIFFAKTHLLKSIYPLRCTRVVIVCRWCFELAKCVRYVQISIQVYFSHTMQTHSLLQLFDVCTLKEFASQGQRKLFETIKGKASYCSISY